jgi:hypothetical protein
MPRRPRRPLRIGPRTCIHEEPEGLSVKVMRRGREFYQYFGYAVWGGRTRALVAAQHFRDRLLQRIEPDTRDRRQAAQGRRSKTGVVGVTIEHHKVDGRVYERYVASWQDPEKGPQRRRFLVERYGRGEAFARAIGARRRGVARRRADMLARQREEARQRLLKAAPMPRPVKDPRSRKGIRMGRRRRRRVK